MRNWLILFVAGLTLAQSDFDKCKYEVPETTCDMYVGELIVFDSKSAKCTIQSSGCSVESVAVHSFASLEDCETQCRSKPRPKRLHLMRKTPLRNREKCNYRVEDSCEMYIGDHVVFDSNQSKCIVQSSACSLEKVQQHSFDTVEECERTCLVAKKRLQEKIDKCSYELPRITCQQYIGRNIVYDSKTKRCTVQTSGCSADALAAYTFETFDECRKHCMN